MSVTHEEVVSALRDSLAISRMLAGAGIGGAQSFRLVRSLAEKEPAEVQAFLDLLTTSISEERTRLANRAARLGSRKR